MRSGVQQIPPMNAVHFGANAAEALALEVESRRSRRAFLLVSGTLNRETDEIEKVRELLGDRYAAEFDQMPQHMPRDAILKAAEVARSAKTDLVVTIGGGSVTDAGKTLTVCLEHDICKLEDFEPFVLKVSPDAATRVRLAFAAACPDADLSAAWPTLWSRKRLDVRGMSPGHPAAVLQRVHEVGSKSDEKAEAFARAFTPTRNVLATTPGNHE